MANLEAEEYSLPEVSLWSRDISAFGVWTHIRRCRPAMGVCLFPFSYAYSLGRLGTAAYLRAGSLPKKVTKVIKQTRKINASKTPRGPMVAA